MHLYTFKKDQSILQILKSKNLEVIIAIDWKKINQNITQINLELGNYWQA